LEEAFNAAAVIVLSEEAMSMKISRPSGLLPIEIMLIKGEASESFLSQVVVSA
jgi:hypothetical protein